MDTASTSVANPQPADLLGAGLLESFLASTADLIYFKDEQSRFIKASQAFARFLGLESAEQLLGRTDGDFYSADKARAFLKQEEEILRTGQPVLDELEKQTGSDGQPRWFLASRVPIRSPQGRVIGLSGLLRDISAFRKTEEQFAFDRDLVQTLLENSQDHIYFKDRRSRFVSYSAAFGRRFHFEDSDDLRGKTDFDCFAESHARPAFEDEQEIMRTGLPMLDKLEEETFPDGRVGWVLTSKMPWRDREGSIIGTFGISKDVTALEEAKKELARTRDLAVESTRLKSVFLANMSHEIRTPMNGIIGMAGLLQDTNLTPEQRDFANTIRTSADALLTIINDILDFSKIEAGKLSFETIDFDLGEAVEGAIELLAEKAQSKNLELLCFINPGVPTRLRGDPGRLRQIISNLVANAVKFTKAGEVELEIQCASENEAEAQLRFMIRDTGIGIPLEAQGRLFQAFTQADDSVTRRYGGTGLGLAISKQLVELMGGTISLESAPGKGSTFSFTVRLTKQQPADPARAASHGDLTGLRVLIVDDNETNRHILEYQLRAWRMENKSVADGLEALAALRQAAAAGQPFDLGILDMQMPGLDGLTLAGQIKADPILARTRLVLLTSLAQRLPEPQLTAAGVGACILKPVKQSRLFDCLANVMSATQTPRVMNGHHHSNGAAPASTASCAGLRVLLAEDNIVNQKIALRQLQKLKIPAEAVANGLEVLQSLKNVPYDVIMMDCQMPEMDGYEASRRIRADDSGSNGAARPYIIALTANALSGDREKCLAAGMNDYLSKPVQIAQLEAALKRAAAALAA